ncbi:MAG: DUF3365 domain-containing protein [Akkermansiaceae bacterium]|jgi:hypothetical protein|nr:DUF3365 domain-containing protein [Akkermansiaceae bacterium]
MKPTFLTATFILSLALLACERKTAVNHVPREEALKVARDAAQEAFQQLSGELAQAIQAGGTVAAIPVCKSKAESLVSKVAGERELSMIRLSDRPRNPSQMATGADLAAIESFRAAILAGNPPSPAVSQEADGSTLVRLPIVASQPLCLQCHGSDNDISAETRAAILASYPDDKATGYRLNELRGIWRIGVRAP